MKSLCRLLLGMFTLAHAPDAHAANVSLEGGVGFAYLSETFDATYALAGQNPAVVKIGKTKATELGFRLGINASPHPFVDVSGEMNLFFAFVPLHPEFQELADQVEQYDMYITNYSGRGFLGPRVSGKIPNIPAKPWLSFGFGYGGYWTQIKNPIDDDSFGSQGFAWDFGLGADYVGLPILSAGLAYHISSISLKNDGDYNPGSSLGVSSLHLRVGANF